MKFFKISKLGKVVGIKNDMCATINRIYINITNCNKFSFAT